METIKQVLMRRDGMTASEADQAIQIAKDELNEHLATGDLEMAEQVCEDHFGLEPDWLDDLLMG